MAWETPTDIQNLMCDYYTGLINTGGAGEIRIYTGTAPSRDAAATGTNTSTHTLLADAYQDASAGVAQENTIADDTNAAAGTMSYMRILDGNDRVIGQGSVGTSGENLNFPDGLVVDAGDTIEIDDFPITCPYLGA